MVNIVDLSQAKPSPAGLIRHERIWSLGERLQGSGQDSPETLGGEGEIKIRKKAYLNPIIPAFSMRVKECLFLNQQY
jgi:hypothetical protein